MMEHHLLKLLRAKSHESLEFILRCLWRSRKLGLDASEKDQIKDLLELSSAHELDPVIVCLRSLIRKSAHGNSKEELQRSFPLDFPPQLQELLLLLLLRLQSEWREDMARDQPEWSSRRASNQNSDAPAMLLPPPLKPSQLNSSWPRIEESRRRSNHSDLTIPMQISSGNLNPSRVLPQQLKGDGAADNSLVSLPRLKAMTWSMENLNSTPANRVAVINLKLQDYSKPSSGEIEIKFQLSRDTLEAMLRSMYYIRDQLSNAVTAPTGPALKKPRQ